MFLPCQKRFDSHRIWHVRTHVLTAAKKGHILLLLRLLCDLNGMSTRTSKTFANTMFALKQRRSFSMIPTLLRNATSHLKMRSDG